MRDNYYLLSFKDGGGRQIRGMTPRTEEGFGSRKEIRAKVKELLFRFFKTTDIKAIPEPQRDFLREVEAWKGGDDSDIYTEFEFNGIQYEIELGDLTE